MATWADAPVLRNCSREMFLPSKCCRSLRLRVRTSDPTAKELSGGSRNRKDGKGDELGMKESEGAPEPWNSWIEGTAEAKKCLSACSDVMFVTSFTSFCCSIRFAPSFASSGQICRSPQSATAESVREALPYPTVQTFKGPSALPLVSQAASRA